MQNRETGSNKDRNRSQKDRTEKDRSEKPSPRLFASGMKNDRKFSNHSKKDRIFGDRFDTIQRCECALLIPTSNFSYLNIQGT